MCYTIHIYKGFGVKLMEIKGSVIDWNNVKQRSIELINEHRAENTIRSNDSKWIREGEVSRIIEYLTDFNSNLSWFQGKVSEDILVQIIVHWITTPFDDRKLLSKLVDGKGMRYNYVPLIVPFSSAEKEEQRDDINNKMKLLKKQLENSESLFSPDTKLISVMQKIKKHKGWDYFNLISEIRNINKDEIAALLIKEKQLAKVYGFEMVYFHRIAQYVKVSEIIVTELLYSIVVRFKAQEQLENLKEILKGLEILEKEVVEHTLKINNEVPYKELQINSYYKTVSPVTQAFVIYMQYKAYVEEMKNIENVLIQDINNNVRMFNDPKPFKHIRYTDYENDRQAILDLKESCKIGTNDYKKLNNTGRYIELMNSKGMQLGFYDDMVLFRIVYREIFMNKVTLSANKNLDTTSLTIAEKILNNCDVTTREEIFLEKKIQRGGFRENNILKEYGVFNVILQKYRDIMLCVLSLPSDTLIYKFIENVLDETLKIIQSQYNIEY